MLSSTTLQKSTTTVAGAIAAVEITHDALLAARNDSTFDDIMQQVAVAQLANDLDPLSAPRTRRPPKKLDDGVVPVELNVETFYRQQFYQVFYKVLYIGLSIQVCTYMLKDFYVLNLSLFSRLQFSLVPLSNFINIFYFVILMVMNL
jgi:hypothetical protein